jgi:hypothetical protein
MWERHQRRCLKAEIQITGLCRNIGTGATQTAPKRHALVGEAGFVEWQVSRGCFLATAGHMERTDLPP